MAYLVLLEDSVSAEAARFRGDMRSAWNQCIAEIAADPWQRAGIGFRIVERQALDPADDMYMVADWFADVIKCHARDCSPEDPSSEFVGEVRIVGLAGLDRTIP